MRMNFCMRRAEKGGGILELYVFRIGKYILDILYGMEFSRRYEENLKLNKKYEQSGEKLLWGLIEDL